MSKRKREDAAAEEIAEMMRNQAGSITQDDIPPSLHVFATMEAAWQEMVDTRFQRQLTKAQMQDVRFIFFNGVQAAYNLMIFCAGQQKLEGAADQIAAEIVAYEKEAESVLRERGLDAEVSELTLPN
jgi:hypothetical protein